jgi:hypothetical protein
VTVAEPVGPVDAFVDGLRQGGARPRIEGGLVLYEVDVVEGGFAGQRVESAVEIAELTRWPIVPPHWVHFPDTVRFAATNSQQSERPGWTKHSRQIARWGAEPHPAAGWLAHVRGVAGEAP